MDGKLYSKRDIIGQGEFYTRHVMAMTAEALHDKSSIAAELAHRDQRISKLAEKLRELADDLESEIEARRVGELPRRIERDLGLVREARALLQEES